MPAHTFYVEDTCALKSDPTKIGQVDRTFGDVTSHRADPLHSYPNGIDRSKRVSSSAFRLFLKTGIPPAGTVLVTWTYLPWQSDLESTLIRESELILTDRCLIVGDVVKRRVEDAISGTVIQTSTSVTLLQPKMWPKGGSSAVISVENKFGNYASNPRTLLKDIPTDDLIPASRWRPDQFIIYKDWVGRIETVYEDVYVRLSNGSVVVVDDPNELDTEVATEDLAVGDYVTTKKGNLRRGRWIYGVFDPAIEPAGYIAETRALRLEVDWLCSRFPAWSSAPSAEPSADVDEDMLESGEIHLYDRRRLPSKDATHHDGDLVHDRSGPSPENTTSLKRIDLDVCVGDAVRFRDIAGAAVKYDGTQRDGSGSLGVQLNRISRMDASGFDINVFQVVQTRTMATILWQDLTTTQMPSTNFIPYIDVGGDDDVWPGELIATTKNISPVDMVYKPENVGIAQSVNARDRMAKVKWFSSGSLMFTEDEEPVLLPTSITSDVSTTVDEVSLYDISTLPGLSRRLGDYIVVQTDPSMDPPPTAIYREAASLAYSTSSNDWFGEVIELGLDGLITVRLGASSNVRDVKVPWECTYLVYSSDFEDDEGEDDNWDMEDEDSMDDEDEDLDSSSSASELVQIKGEDGVWRDVDGMEDIEDWITDEENANDAEDHDSDDGDTLMPDATVRNVDEAPVGQSHARPSYLSFSYGSMFNAIGSGESTPAYVPESFLVLEGEPPQNHHYAGRVAHNSQPQLKRIQKEYKILQTSLPAGVYVRTWESALDLLRVLILGPVGTPYEFAPFVVDLHLDHTFPTLPPLAFFHSWTQGTGPVNPNLYEDGKICLSLLGTWPGDEKNETWSAKSTIMQVLVSLVGLVLVEEPFYNEAGYEARAGTPESRIPSAIYTERTYFKARAFITHALTNPIPAFEKEINAIYLVAGGPQLLNVATRDAVGVVRRSISRTIAVVGGGRAWEGNGTERGEGRTVSPGALVPLKRQILEMVRILKTVDEGAAGEVEKSLGGLV